MPAHSKSATISCLQRCRISSIFSHKSKLQRFQKWAFQYLKDLHNAHLHGHACTSCMALLHGGTYICTAVQFGHLFAKGASREGAIRAMVVALKQVKIRGEIRTTVDYTTDMIQHEAFLGNNHHTGWLDSRIAAHVSTTTPSRTRGASGISTCVCMNAA